MPTVLTNSPLRKMTSQVGRRRSADFQVPKSITRKKQLPRYTSTTKSIVDIAVCLYTVVGCVAAYWQLVFGGDSLFAATLATLLLTHTTIFSGLLTHEAMHNTLVGGKTINWFLGNVMTVISGAFTVSFDRLKHQHLAHHRFQVGYDGFSVTKWARAQPAWLLETLLLLEWCYVPVLSFIARVHSLTAPFLLEKHRELRTRMALALLVDATFFAVIGWWRWRALVCALISYVLMVMILRVYDCFHHVFDIVPLDTPIAEIPVENKDYEQLHTYSSLFSRSEPWMNWLFLNYGYHNAHHFIPATHWLDLPILDEEIYGDSQQHCLIGMQVLQQFHLHRTNRIRFGLGSPTPRDDGTLDLVGYHGIIMNISFLTYDV